MELGDLEVYKLARIISGKGWALYEQFDWRTRKVIGDQFITAIDSIAANVAEGFGRFHYLDRNKFNYNARGSLFESIHWVDVLKERGIVDGKKAEDLVGDLRNLLVRLNGYIATTKNLHKS
ncbi:four helix bundle protein [Patescibacteria group bacterium]|nr:four helix bundle protein [Patescibacteria group bacterium]MCL5114289.1 four helix bundle protein [Patescibacteria group bacterium]